MATFGYILRDLRKSKGLTQRELAAMLGISFSAVSMYERGEREPDFEMIEAIADTFNVDMNYLLGKQEAKRVFSVGTAQNDTETIRLNADELEFLREIRERPEMKIMFSVTKNATKEDLMKAVKIIEALKAAEEGGTDAM